MEDLYIGIENELKSFNENDNIIDFDVYFDDFTRDSDYKEDDCIIRT